MNPDFDKITSEWLRTKMKLHDVGNRDVGDAIGCDQANISNMASGKRKMSKATKSALWHYFKCK